ncbi:thioesterase family protein [Microbacterium kribbense]|uniref:Thioesterase family protein n=1 Tax=Microbacterium kribbense TaxID=433645 RepID=A0ABP7G122_9MICO
MSAYFERIDEAAFRPTPAVAGVWNTQEQHIAPALGLITHVIERAHAARRDDGLQLARISFDILGTMPIDTVEITVRVVRPGRTIELVEATLAHAGRPAVITRAWMLQPADTAAIAGSGFTTMPGPAELEPFDAGALWPGGFVHTVEIRRDEQEPGRARVWLRPRLPLLEGEPISSTARMLGLADIANGMTTRVMPDVAVFPNVDLTAHLTRPPATEWIGFDTSVTFGPHGVGLTHTILHDEIGPIGSVAQALTIRPTGRGEP